MKKTNLVRANCSIKEAEISKYLQESNEDGVYPNYKKNATVKFVQFSERSQLMVQFRLHRFMGKSVTVAFHTCQNGVICFT